jgi:prepilin signal peptidase PulO-like enzyme (type II secretory pathway)
MPLLLALLGAAAGVLINSLADNLPPDSAGVRRGPRRPRCRACGTPHRGLLASGLAGLLLHAGRCEHCRARRPWRPVPVELAAAGALPYLWLWAGRGEGEALAAAARFLPAALIVLAFLLIVVIDVEHRLILRVVVLPAAALTLLFGALDPGRGLVKTVLGGLAGYLLMFGVYLLAQVYAWAQARLRGRPLDDVAFGGGDVNLAAVVGFVVGWPGVLLALLIAVFTGALYSLGIVVPQVVRRRYDPHTAIPYGPFLVAGALVIYLYGKEFSAWWLSR